MHAHEAASIRDAMEQEVSRMAAPGAVWAIASGPPEERRVLVDAAGDLAGDTIFRIASVTKPLAAAAALGLVEDGALGLDDDVARWVPYWAERRVLRAPGARLDDTVAAERPTTLRDLLAMGFGLGYGPADPDDPLANACADAGLYSTWLPPAIPPREWADLAGALPMAHQPGQGFLYQSSFDALTVLIEAATGRGFDDALRERILAPLGMRETGYVVDEENLPRVPANYFPDEGYVDEAPAAEAALTRRPTFCSGATGLLSTAADLIGFAQCLLDGGTGPDGQVLSAASVDAMRTDQLGEAAGRMSPDWLAPYTGWGLGVGIDTRGRFGWNGGTGTYLKIDPEGKRAAVLLTRQGMGDPGLPAVLERFDDVAWG